MVKRNDIYPQYIYGFKTHDMKLWYSPTKYVCPCGECFLTQEYTFTEYYTYKVVRMCTPFDWKNISKPTCTNCPTYTYDGGGDGMGGADGVGGGGGGFGDGGGGGTGF
jgi:uncharacterized membrane protein YgcG